MRLPPKCIKVLFVTVYLTHKFNCWKKPARSPDSLCSDENTFRLQFNKKIFIFFTWACRVTRYRKRLWLRDWYRGDEWKMLEVRTSVKCIYENSWYCVWFYENLLTFFKDDLKIQNVAFAFSKLTYYWHLYLLNDNEKGSKLKCFT